MTRQTANVAASVRARLLNQSRETGEDFQFLLQRYAAERFLYRLGGSPYRETFVLKGAMLFALWGGSIYRATRDLDFTGYGTSEEDAVLAALREIFAVAVPDDGLRFEAEALRAEPIRDDAEYDGLRIRFHAMLDTARIPMQIDIGFGNAIEPPATEVEYPTLLDAPAPRIRAYPRESVAAEKLHAVAVLGERNSRIKGFFDLHHLASRFAFDRATLAEAVRRRFARRRTPVPEVAPIALTREYWENPSRAAQMRAFARRAGIAVPDNFANECARLLDAFLSAILEDLRGGRKKAATWPPGGPWRSRDSTGGAAR